jgi:hypothetical protein
MGRLGPIELGQDLASAPDHLLVLRGARLVEERRHLLLPHGLDAVHPEQRGLAPDGLHLLHEPLEQLSGLRGLGEDPGGPPQADGAHPLELSPDADAVPRRGRGQAQEQGQPAHVCEGNA